MFRSPHEGSVRRKDSCCGMSPKVEGSDERALRQNGSRARSGAATIEELGSGVEMGLKVVRSGIDNNVADLANEMKARQHGMVMHCARGQTHSSQSTVGKR